MNYLANILLIKLNKLLVSTYIQSSRKTFLATSPVGQVTDQAH